MTEMLTRFFLEQAKMGIFNAKLAIHFLTSLSIIPFDI